jgi:hypothetical protein
MMTRSTTTAVVGRASSIRRLRRRAQADRRQYCSTNGCASFLSLDPATGRVVCAICGYSRPAA